jgi:small subunit ribosomal protein S6
VREYEIVYVIKPDLSDDDRASKVARIHGLITENGGEIAETSDWGKKTLAYEIRHFAEGYYGLTQFRLPSKSVEVLKDRLNLDEDFLRFQVVARSE